tara:strand:- start:13 stop:234 length:222 start_codon:yes stop_codon:yes gene_type:complete
MNRSEIEFGKIIIDFPDSHKDIAEGLKDAIINEFSEQENKTEEEDYGCVIGQHQNYYSPIFHDEEEEDEMQSM